MAIRVSVQQQDFDVGDACRSLTSSACGAIVQFVGVMRAHNEGDEVVSMLLEHYPGMTERSITEIAEQAVARWALGDVQVIHRVGTLQPGEKIVLVAVSAAHRQAAFSACEYIMDYLKTRAPFWKKEQLLDGRSRWVDARQSDASAALRWD